MVLFKDTVKVRSVNTEHRTKWQGRQEAQVIGFLQEA